ncbi:UNVERIFIED_CONTAM: hypothetical protein H355_009932 [Colinus virginianus]|nr:hypothetical protein H355_009932 [Colinus virginianus]
MAGPSVRSVGCKRPAGGDAEGLRAGGKRSRPGRREGKEKSSRLSAALLGEDCEISQEQLYELLQYAALGKSHNASQPSSGLQCDPIIQKYGKEKRGLTSYTLSSEELKKNDYPMRDSPGCKGYMYTECDLQRTDSSPLFGLDCEMCLTARGNEVTRVSLVDAEGQCLLNELVKPESVIVNYCTRYSGITRKMLLPVKTRLPDIQTRLKKILPRDAVLVGHSLNADLRALQMIHPSVIDTSLLFARNEGRRFKLKFLAKAVLGKEIQCEQRLGHDPAEDARAALELAQFFIEKGPVKILQRALEHIPLSTFSIIQFSLDPEYVASGFCEKVRNKLTDMLTIYAGPFEENFCLKSVKKEFGRCGPIQSLTVVTETYQPYVCIQYDVLEAAQLAVETLNGAEVAGSCIKVQRPITAATLDCDVLIKELEVDIENEGMIYVAGIKKSLTEADLQEEFSPLKDLETLFLPKDLQSGKHRTCCFLKFQKSQSAVDALEAINGWATKGSTLRSRHALAPGHLWRWIWQMNHSSEKQGGNSLSEKMAPLSDSEQDVKKKVKKIDQHIKKLYRSLQNNTLCVVLFPGMNRYHSLGEKDGQLELFKSKNKR